MDYAGKQRVLADKKRKMQVRERFRKVWEVEWQVRGADD